MTALSVARRLARKVRSVLVTSGLGGRSRLASPADVVRRTRVGRIPLAAWRPEPQVRLHRSDVRRAAVPAIDVHNHLGRWLDPNGAWMIRDVDALLRVLDAVEVRAVVNLDGRWGDELTANIERYDRAHPGRFATFCHVDWSLLRQEGGPRRLLEGLEDSARRGARGLKVWKDLGLAVRDASGRLVLPDDPRVVEVMERAGELGLPVLIHTGDPRAFFAPLDRRNERLDELAAHPDWWFGDAARYPSHERLLTALETLVVSTPRTQYIGAHLGGSAEDLDRVSALMDRASNWAVDVGGRLAEVGRQPRRFRALVDRHPDRILFGSDAFTPDEDAYRTWFRFLETEDESFEYAPGEDVPPQGRWTISGAGLSAASLEMVYADNAHRLLGL